MGRSVVSRVRKRLKRTGLLALKSVRHRANRATSSDLSSVLFVSGVQRSGTNMLMDTLENSFETEVFHEIDSRAFDDYHLRDADILHDLHAGSGAKVTIFKALLEAHKINELMAEFPGSRAIWTFRRYQDMVNSHMRSWPDSREHLDAIVAGSNDVEIGYRSRGMSGDTLALLREYYREDMSDASALALFWYHRNQLMFDQGLDRNDSVLVAEYEQIVGTPEKVAREVCAFAGLKFSPRLIGHIHSRSVGKNVAPDIAPDIAELCDDMLVRLKALTLPAHP